MMMIVMSIMMMMRASGSSAIGVVAVLGAEEAPAQSVIMMVSMTTTHRLGMSSGEHSSVCAMPCSFSSSSTGAGSVPFCRRAQAHAQRGAQASGKASTE